MNGASDAFASGSDYRQPGGFDLSTFDSCGQSIDGPVKMEDLEMNQDETEAEKREPSSGPVRGSISKSSAEDSLLDESVKAPIAAPVKSACTFCRSRKSRCNGKQPCAACTSRAQPDDCIYTVSRRGGKPKPKVEKMEPMDTHLEKILDLSDLPHLVRIPNVFPQLQGFMEEGEGSKPFSEKPTFPHSALSPAFSTSSVQSQSTSLHYDNSPSIKELLTHFYTYFYRFVPILPNATHIDQIATTISAESPFVLAMQCVLPIIRDEPLVATNSANDTEKKAHIRTQSSYFAKRAESAIDAILERMETRPEEEDYHTLEVIQSLCLLIIYEYGSGRALKARLKADTALGIAMSKGLHRLTPYTGNNGIKSPPAFHAEAPHFLSLIADEEMYEVRKRMWWSLWSMTMWTAYNSGRIPTIRADDPRITSELPRCKDGKAWAYVVSSLQGLLLVQDRILALSNLEHGRIQSSESNQSSAMPTSKQALPNLPFLKNSTIAKGPSADAINHGIPASFSGHPTMSSRQDILQSMLDIDNALQDQMRVLEQTTEGIVSTPVNSPSSITTVDDDTRYLNFVWAMQLYTASLTLHVGQAFQGATLFERKLCFLSSISESNDAAACQVPMPNAFDDQGILSYSPTSLSLATEQELYARGPFLPNESLKRCVDASDKLLRISRNLRELKGPYASPNNPFNACSFVLISFVCLMQALAISSNITTEEDTQGLSLSSTLMSSDGSGNTSSLLKSAQGAAALNTSTFSTANTTDQSVRQQQLQVIWARVKEAKGTLQELARHWDMVIPMADEVGGCLEASQFLLSQQNFGSAPSMDFQFS
ncbi:hypothetical protein CBS101457_004720 [Exobasidium rhododendri]|nr:hypothetical protein CBS101457_004720 [Exobasidium rhododendri]